jgi:hypothetical protein
VNLTPFALSVDHCARSAPGGAAPACSGVFLRVQVPFPAVAARRSSLPTRLLVHCMRPDHPAFLFIFVEDHPCPYLVPFPLFNPPCCRALAAVCSVPA